MEVKNAAADSTSPITSKITPTMTEKQKGEIYQKAIAALESRVLDLQLENKSMFKDINDLMMKAEKTSAQGQEGE